MTEKEIQSDLKKWQSEVTPILGDVNILVYAKESDICNNATPYSGGKYDILKNAGFKHYISVSSGAKAWSELTREYVRYGRLVISGSALENTPQLYTGIFDAASVLDSNR